jgi:hypothetical protein
MIHRRPPAAPGGSGSALRTSGVGAGESGLATALQHTPDDAEPTWMSSMCLPTRTHTWGGVFVHAVADGVGHIGRRGRPPHRGQEQPASVSR